MKLSDVRPGQTVRVVELRSSDPARLERLAAYGLAPGSLLTVEQLSPALILRVDGTVLSVDRAVAEEIVVGV